MFIWVVVDEVDIDWGRDSSFWDEVRDGEEVGERLEDCLPSR